MTEILYRYIVKHEAEALESLRQLRSASGLVENITCESDGRVLRIKRKDAVAELEVAPVEPTIVIGDFGSSLEIRAPVDLPESVFLAWEVLIALHIEKPAHVWLSALTYPRESIATLAVVRPLPLRGELGHLLTSEEFEKFADS